MSSKMQSNSYTMDSMLRADLDRWDQAVAAQQPLRFRYYLHKHAARNQNTHAHTMPMTDHNKINRNKRVEKGSNKIELNQFNGGFRKEVCWIFKRERGAVTCICNHFQQLVVFSNRQVQYQFISFVLTFSNDSVAIRLAPRNASTQYRSRCIRHTCKGGLIAVSWY